MDIEEGQTLESWFLNLRNTLEVFPDNFNFVTRYEHIKGVIENKVQPYIDQGAQQVEHINGNKDKKTLTGHGPKHFSDLIERTTKLVKAEGCKLSPYEVYLLLVAIQVHDIGNILGRENHESRMREVFYDFFEGDRTLDGVENCIFLDIAEAHSGNKDGDKDTIGKLSDTTHLNEGIKVQLLASILRFADELTDNPKRAHTYLREKNLTEPSSDIYHVYAESLKSTDVFAHAKKVDLRFAFDVSVATEKIKKDSDEQYLLDEIFERTKKAHTEKVYCMRYMRPYCPIEHINVDIDIYDKGYRKKILVITYKLIDSGYPEYIMEKDILELCEDNKGIFNRESNERWDGEILKAFIENLQNDE